MTFACICTFGVAAVARAGGPCLDGLSPAGKARMFEMRLAWVFSHDEYMPCDLAVPPGYVEP